MVPTVEPKVTKDFQTILSWAQKAKQLGIRANADTPDAAKLSKTVWCSKGLDCVEQSECLTRRTGLECIR